MNFYNLVINWSQIKGTIWKELNNLSLIMIWRQGLQHVFIIHMNKVKALLDRHIFETQLNTVQEILSIDWPIWLQAYLG